MKGKRLDEVAEAYLTRDRLEVFMGEAALLAKNANGVGAFDAAFLQVVNSALVENGFDKITACACRRLRVKHDLLLRRGRQSVPTAADALAVERLPTEAKQLAFERVRGDAALLVKKFKDFLTPLKEEHPKLTEDMFKSACAAALNGGGLTQVQRLMAERALLERHEALTQALTGLHIM